MKRETGSGVPHNQSRNASLFSIEGEKVSSKLPTKLVGEADSLPGGASFAGENVQSHGGVSQENALSTSENLSPQASVPRLPNVGVATKADAMAYDTAVIFPSKERVEPKAKTYHCVACKSDAHEPAVPKAFRVFPDIDSSRKSGLCGTCADVVRRVEANDFNPPKGHFGDMFELKSDVELALREAWLAVRPSVIASAWSVVLELQKENQRRATALPTQPPTVGLGSATRLGGSASTSPRTTPKAGGDGALASAHASGATFFSRSFGAAKPLATLQKTTNVLGESTDGGSHAMSSQLSHGEPGLDHLTSLEEAIGAINIPAVATGSDSSGYKTYPLPSSAARLLQEGPPVVPKFGSNHPLTKIWEASSSSQPRSNASTAVPAGSLSAEELELLNRNEGRSAAMQRERREKQDRERLGKEAAKIAPWERTMLEQNEGRKQRLERERREKLRRNQLPAASTGLWTASSLRPAKENVDNTSPRASDPMDEDQDSKAKVITETERQLLDKLMDASSVRKPRTKLQLTPPAPPVPVQRVPYVAAQALATDAPMDMRRNAEPEAPLLPTPAAVGVQDTRGSAVEPAAPPPSWPAAGSQPVAARSTFTKISPFRKTQTAHAAPDPSHDMEVTHESASLAQDEATAQHDMPDQQEGASNEERPKGPTPFHTWPPTAPYQSQEQAAPRPASTPARPSSVIPRIRPIIGPPAATCGPEWPELGGLFPAGASSVPSAELAKFLLSIGTISEHANVQPMTWRRLHAVFEEYIFTRMLYNPATGMIRCDPPLAYLLGVTELHCSSFAQLLAVKGHWTPSGLAIPPGPGGLAVLGDRLKKRKATVQGGTEDRWAHRGTTTAMAKQSSSHLYTTDAAAELAGAPPPGVANTIGPGIGSTGPDSLRDFKPEDLIGVFLSKVDIVAFQHLRNFRALVVGCYVGVWEKKPGAEHGEAPLRHTVQIVNVLQRNEDGVPMTQLLLDTGGVITPELVSAWGFQRGDLENFVVNVHNYRRSWLGSTIAAERASSLSILKDTLTASAPPVPPHGASTTAAASASLPAAFQLQPPAAPIFASAAAGQQNAGPHQFFPPPASRALYPRSQGIPSLMAPTSSGESSMFARTSNHPSALTGGGGSSSTNQKTPSSSTAPIEDVAGVLISLRTPVVTSGTDASSNSNEGVQMVGINAPMGTTNNAISVSQQAQRKKTKRTNNLMQNR